MNTQPTWQELRAQWVNGVRKPTRTAFARLSKRKQLAMIAEALQQFADLQYQSGDLTDLREIIHFTLREGDL